MYRKLIFITVVFIFIYSCVNSNKYVDVQELTFTDKGVDEIYVFENEIGIKFIVYNDINNNISTAYKKNNEYYSMKSGISQYNYLISEASLIEQFQNLLGVDGIKITIPISPNLFKYFYYQIDNTSKNLNLLIEIEDSDVVEEDIDSDNTKEIISSNGVNPVYSRVFKAKNNKIYLYDLKKSYSVYIGNGVFEGYGSEQNDHFYIVMINGNVIEKQNISKGVTK
ncbi:MAG: hypothetical protein ACYCWE_20010 [Eubacteriales bacterium]